MGHLSFLQWRRQKCMSAISQTPSQAGILGPRCAHLPWCKLHLIIRPSPANFLQLSGFWLVIFLGRWSMILGWKDFIKTKLMPHHEFVSADARRFSNDPRTYEMLSSRSTPNLNIRSPDRAVTSPSSIKSTTFSPQEDQKADYFGKATRAYVSPVSSYSSPRPPSVSQTREWDPRSTHARGGPTATLPGVALSKDFS